MSFQKASTPVGQPKIAMSFMKGNSKEEGMFYNTAFHTSAMRQQLKPVSGSQAMVYADLTYPRTNITSPSAHSPIGDNIHSLTHDTIITSLHINNRSKNSFPGCPLLSMTKQTWKSSQSIDYSSFSPYQFTSTLNHNQQESLQQQTPQESLSLPSRNSLQIHTNQLHHSQANTFISPFSHFSVPGESFYYEPASLAEKKSSSTLLNESDEDAFENDRFNKHIFSTLAELGLDDEEPPDNDQQKSAFSFHANDSASFQQDSLTRQFTSSHYTTPNIMSAFDPNASTFNLFSQRRPHRSVPSTGYICRLCLVEGHWMEDCTLYEGKPIDLSNSPVKQTHPLVPGLVKELPYYKKRPVPPSDYTCKSCHVSGHWLQNCAYKPVIPPSYYSCHLCQIRGHWIEHCPEIVKRNSEN